ncbi:LacI family transcriptional regulator [Ktedonobacter sp. SOSP1-52]|uniref:LacI family DNA-binding transcriptional regulator n=1 Tax=Ktedonobacter sp. SOSP1-52 TaxID=2778366 RepID=UPI001916780B|nr:LacI family DNA-binding transcriptional regulator [Ktedonobacter sp. SOSP1-52]GHO65190.1 LacI family transcriptional regulator [Ktedonobacter sp. SOSP1-52]
MRQRETDKGGQMAREITIVDVADEAGVSYATVSRVINNKAHVSPEKRERVLRAMAQLGYVVNMQARSLAGGESRVVGLLVDYLSSSYIDEIIRGIDEALDAENYDLMLYTTHRRKTKESAYVTKLTRGLADGLLLILPRNAAAYLDTLRQRQFPHVIVDYLSNKQNVPSVSATNFRGAYDAMSFLLSLGHQRIGFITGTMELGSARDRLDGYHAALKDHGIPADSHLICEGDFTQPQGYQYAQELLSLPERPTAIFASNDMMAFGVMEAARERGLRLPEDLSIVGFDDIPQASYVHPALTTIRQPLEEMGRSATHLLLKYIAHPNAEIERIELPTRLIIRESCQALSS